MCTDRTSPKSAASSPPCRRGDGRRQEGPSAAPTAKDNPRRAGPASPTVGAAARLPSSRTKSAECRGAQHGWQHRSASNVPLTISYLNVVALVNVRVFKDSYSTTVG